MQVQKTPASDCISSGESIPGELLLSRAHFRFDSITKFIYKNYIYKLLKKLATFSSSENVKASVADGKKLTLKKNSITIVKTKEKRDNKIILMLIFRHLLNK